MTVNELLQQELLSEIKQLPGYRLREVLDFVRFLGARSTPMHNLPVVEAGLSEDPILEFIGGISHGALAQGIDEALYGV